MGEMKYLSKLNITKVLVISHIVEAYPVFKEIRIDLCTYCIYCWILIMEKLVLT